MDKNDIRIYNANLGLDSTIEERINWPYRYSDDYSDEAVDEIASQAELFGLHYIHGTNVEKDVRQIYGDVVRVI